MQNSTTVRVSPGTRDALRELAVADGVSLDEETARLVRAERQRRIGAALARTELDDADRRWIALGTAEVHAGR
jgi:hypothetical protein